MKNHRKSFRIALVILLAAPFILAFSLTSCQDGTTTPLQPIASDDASQVSWNVNPQTGEVQMEPARTVDLSLQVSRGGIISEQNGVNIDTHKNASMNILCSSNGNISVTGGSLTVEGKTYIGTKVSFPGLNQLVFRYPYTPVPKQDASGKFIPPVIEPYISLNSDAPVEATFSVSGYTLPESSIEIPGRVTIQGLKHKDVVSASAPLTVQWSVQNTPHPTMGTVLINQTPDIQSLHDQGKSPKEIEEYLKAFRPKYFSKTVKNTSKVEFTVAEMLQLKGSKVQLNVQVQNIKTVRNGGKFVNLWASSADALHLRVQ